MITDKKIKPLNTKAKIESTKGGFSTEREDHLNLYNKRGEEVEGLNKGEECRSKSPDLEFSQNQFYEDLSPLSSILSRLR